MPPEICGEQTKAVKSFEEAKAAFLREYVSSLMAQSGGRVAKAAELAKLTRAYVYRLLEDLKIPVRKDCKTAEAAK